MYPEKGEEDLSQDAEVYKGVWVWIWAWMLGRGRGRWG